MGRYDLIYKSENNSIRNDSPVALKVTSLFYDNVEKKNISLLKFENLSGKTVDSLKVRLVLSDGTDNTAFEPVLYEYSNIKAESRTMFGDKVPILITQNAKSIKVDEIQIIFKDGSIWNSDSELDWSLLTHPAFDEKITNKQCICEKEEKNKIKFNNKKDGTILLSIVCFLLGILIFVDGFFKYNWYFSESFIPQLRSFGSFSFLTRYSGMQLIFDLIIIAVLSAIIVFAWIQHKSQKQIRCIYSICSTVTLLTMLIGTISGKASFSFYQNNYSPKLERFVTWEYEYVSLGFLFFIYLIITISLIVLCIMKDLNILKGKNV